MSSRRYQPFYCEENIWWLAREPQLAGAERWVMFISNRDQQVAMCQQRASGAQPVMLWDYHVVLLVRGSDRTEVWDLDSKLALPCELSRYLALTFPELDESFAHYAPLFRLVPQQQFEALFASDRSHMRDADGGFQEEPPSWPPIGDGHNLMRFVDMDDDIAGEVLTLAQLRARQLK